MPATQTARFSVDIELSFFDARRISQDPVGARAREIRSALSEIMELLNVSASRACDNNCNAAEVLD